MPWNPKELESAKAIALAIVGVESLDVDGVREVVKLAAQYHGRIVSRSADPVAARQAVTITSSRPQPITGDAHERGRAHHNAAKHQLTQRLALADAISREMVDAHAAVTWLTGCSLLAGDIDFATGKPVQATSAFHLLSLGAFDAVVAVDDGDDVVVPDAVRVIRWRPA